MKLKRSIRAVTLTMVAVLAGLGISTPAFAARGGFDQIYVDFDSEPDRVFSAWVSNLHRTIDFQVKGPGWGWVEYTLYGPDSAVKSVEVRANSQGHFSFSRSIRTFRVCGDEGPWVGVQCKGWNFLDA